MEQTAGRRFTAGNHFWMIFKDCFTVCLKSLNTGDFFTAHLFPKIFTPDKTPLSISLLSRRNCVIAAVNTALFPLILTNQVAKLRNNLVDHIRNVIPCAIISIRLIRHPHCGPNQVNRFTGRERQIITRRPVRHNLYINIGVDQFFVHLIGGLIDHIDIIRRRTSESIHH